MNIKTIPPNAKYIVMSDCHRPVFANLSLTERRFLERGIGTRGVRRKDKADPVYYNTGSCVHPRCITGIEITAAPPKDDGPIRPHFTLVKWGYLEEKPGRLPRKNRGDSQGKTGATPYFLFSENRELYRLFRATGWE